ncbi:uncharacterized protein N7473_001685 [Penicillium subrubescens]|uniref:Uncharacterized protein n=1 Tax=Penicillium subrubescens TaxID=1316194 RepID=A0A1Q5UBQ4_9EURO|nr:uncharacterized protein N7473_001685 [Penicillium subrubescens]KAJ5904769.1 hypothetical protein N7473_001685 [Penicillium subrubescens]OKP09897.1 hypothetical protein PENSUB_4728 [Penicillium subrubescens]
MQSQQARQFYLITAPRTGSHLLLKILALEDQPNVLFRETGGYFFLPLIVLREELQTSWKHLDSLTAEQKTKEQECMESCLRDFELHAERANIEGKLVIVKEHSYFLTDPVAQSRFLFGEESFNVETPLKLQTSNSSIPETSHSVHNETFLSDEILKAWHPIFLIKHPALAFPSYYRAFLKGYGEEFTKSIAGQREFQMVMTMRWTRKLYDFYSECKAPPVFAKNQATWPIVLDADDILCNPSVVTKLCDIVGIDSDRLRYTWDMNQIQQDLSVEAFTTTLNNSTTIDTTKVAGDIDLSDEAKKWRAEFGDAEGEMIEGHTRAAIPDYLFLRSQRLRA